MNNFYMIISLIITLLFGISLGSYAAIRSDYTNSTVYVDKLSTICQYYRGHVIYNHQGNYAACINRNALLPIKEVLQ